MDLGLKGKRIIVTGGSRGIGKAIIETVLNEGADVATGARGADLLQRLRPRWQSSCLWASNMAP